MPSPTDTRDIHVTQFQKPVSLPSRFVTDISMLPVDDQMQNGSCVGHAIAKGIQLLDYLELGKVTHTSPRFVYARAKATDGLSGEGTYPRIGLSVVQKDGCATEDTVPCTDTLPHAKYIQVDFNTKVLNDAKPRKVKGYAFVSYDAYSMKQAIVQNGFIVVALNTDGKTWGNGPKVMPGNAGGHYILVYGYEEKGADTRFLFRNSWGDEWGDKGNGYFYWSDYAKNVYDAYVITDIPNELIDDVKSQDYVFSKKLKFGSRGYDVVQLQKRLNKDGFPCGKEDGVFGATTQKAVKLYQKAHGLIADGIVGPSTIAALNKNVSRELVDALIMVESQGDDMAIGDKDLKDKAYGCLQIRKPCIDDVNKANGTKHKAQECLGNRDLSRWVFFKYMDLYATEKNVGRPVTDEDRARIWNGGPSGWKKKSTIPYWEKAKKHL